MPPKKRAAPATEEPVAKRRSLRRAAKEATYKEISEEPQPKPKPAAKSQAKKDTAKKAAASKKTEAAPAKTTKKDATASAKGKKSSSKESASKAASSPKTNGASSGRAMSEDPDFDSIPTTNPDAPKHDGEWYWLMKAEPESRFENGVDVKFSIDDLRAKKEPEGWDGIRNYVARNNMRNMNAGDKAFFYHSNCKEPGIAGIMEIVKEFSQDRTARRPGPYHDPSATKDKPKWDLVHVSFRKKFAVPIGLKELRDLGAAGGPLEGMQMLKQSRLSVSRVSAEEWKALCELADRKAKEAGLEHEV